MDKRLILALILFAVFGSMYFLLPSRTDNKETNGEMIISGDYESVLGVMNRLSCFCGNAGYLTTEKNEKVSLCFPDSGKAIGCTSIEVKGSYQAKEINPESTSPCQKGTMVLFYVSNYECK